MIRRPPESTRTDTLFPYTTLCRSVTATCVRVPVFVGHAKSINIEFERPISAKQAQAILREAPGIMLVDKREDGGYVTPIECVGDYATFISRVRKAPTVENGIAR